MRNKDLHVAAIVQLLDFDHYCYSGETNLLPQNVLSKWSVLCKLSSLIGVNR